MTNLPLILAVDGGALAVYLVGLALSIGLAVAAASLQKKGKRDPNQPIPTQVLQGGFISRIIGRRRVAPTVLAIGARNVSKQRQGSGKNKGPAVYTYFESGWHAICVGPAYALHRIWVDGVPLNISAISRDDTPSGSFIPTPGLRGRGGFYIYWGDEVQPRNSLVESLIAQSDPTLPAGIASGWPFLCYVVWSDFQLNQTPIWPQVEYEIEVRPIGGVVSEDFARAAVHLPYQFSDPDFVTPTGTESFQLSTTFEISETGLWTGTNEAPPANSFAGTGANIVRMFYIDPTIAAYTWSGDVSLVRAKLIGPSAQEILLFEETSLGILYDSSNTAVPTGWVVESYHADGRPVSIYKDIDMTGDVDFDEIGTWTLQVQIDSDMSGNPNPGISMPFLNLGAVLDVQSPTAGAPAAGTWIEDGAQVGANPADAYLELLTENFPHGAGIDSSLLNTLSFSEWHDVGVAEVLPCNIYAANGELAEDVLATIMTDHGYFLSYNPNEGCGKFRAQALRDNGVVLDVAAEQCVGERPEVETPLLSQPFDRVMFTFQDKNRDYRETAIVVDEDGQASLLEVQRAVKSPIYTATDYATARYLAEVKSQEDLPKTTGYRLDLNRDANLLWPGLSIDIQAVDPDQQARLKIMEIAEEQLTTRTQVVAVEDNYEADLTAFAGVEPPTGGAATSQPVADLAAAILEIPTVLLQTRQTRVAILRIRDNDQILGAVVYFSSDGTTYLANQSVTDAVVGGTIASGAIAADDPYLIEEGPVVTIQGDDTDQVEDLTSDEPAWRAGRQVAVIGNEIFFVRKFQAITSTTYRLEGLIRARYGTDREAHNTSDQVFLFIFSEATDLSDPKILPGQTLYSKPAPYTQAGALSLASVTALTKTIRGNGVVPDPVTCLRVTAPRRGVPDYRTGEDVTFEWGYINMGIPGTGAGLQGYGDAAGSVEPYGTFEIVVLDNMAAEVATYNVGTDTTWTYDNATLQADLGGETDFSIEVRNVNGGFRSAARTLSITFQ